MACPQCPALGEMAGVGIGTCAQMQPCCVLHAVFSIYIACFSLLTCAVCSVSLSRGEEDLGGS